jgi:hypothetical protein
MCPTEATVTNMIHHHIVRYGTQVPTRQYVLAPQRPVELARRRSVSNYVALALECGPVNLQAGLDCDLLGLRDSDALADAFGAYDSNGNDTILRRAIAPGVTRPVLHNTVARLQQNFSSIIEFQIDFAGEDHIEVHSVGGVHAGVHWLDDLRQSRQLLLQFAKGHNQVRIIGKLIGIWRHGEEKEAETTGRWEVTGMRGRRPIAWQLGLRVGAPNAMKFKPGKRRDDNWFHLRVLGDDGGSGGSAAGYDATNIHEEASFPATTFC